MKAIGIGLVVVGVAGVLYEGYNMYQLHVNNTKSTAAGISTVGLPMTSYILAGAGVAAIIAGVVIIKKHK